MKKLVCALSLLSLSPSLLAMESDSESTSSSSTISEEKEKDHLLYIANTHMAGIYRNFRNDYSSVDKWWRKQFKNGDIQNNIKFAKRVEPFKQFAEVMEEGKNEFNAQETFEEMPKNKKGMWIRLATIPATAKEIKDVYGKTPYIYKILSGTIIIDKYLQEKRSKERIGSIAEEHSMHLAELFGKLAALRFNA